MEETEDNESFGNEESDNEQDFEKSKVEKSTKPVKQSIKPKEEPDQDEDETSYSGSGKEFEARFSEPDYEREGEDLFVPEPFRYFPSGEAWEEEGETRPEDPCTEIEGEDDLKDMGSQEEQNSESTSETLSNVYEKLSPFNIEWAFGVKKDIELINLTTNKTHEVFYVSCHFGIVYNYRRNTMSFLPGHNFPITSISADQTGRWLVTADAGDDTVIIIWDNHKKIPVWSLYNVFPGGVRHVKISQDARFLAAINCDFDYSLKFWMWTYGRENPDGVVNMNPALGKAKHIGFNHLNTTQFAITMEFGVIFCQWNQKAKVIETYEPNFHFPDTETKNLRESIFLDNNHKAVSSTKQGFLAVWSDLGHHEDPSEHPQGTIEKKYLKCLRIHKSGITSLRLCDRIIATSSEEGSIYFHDQELRLMFFFPKPIHETLVSLSFNISPEVDCDPFSPEFQRSDDTSDEISWTSLSEDKHSEMKIEKVEKKIESETCKIKESQSDVLLKNTLDCTLEERPFIIRDFIFLVKSGKFAYTCHKKMKTKYYFDEINSSILAIDCSPNKSHVVIGNAAGDLSLYDYNEKKLISSSKQNGPIKTLKYSNFGLVLMAGLQTGVLKDYDPVLLHKNFQLKTSKSAIMKICFSPNDQLLACYDQNSTVYICKKVLKSNDWRFMGKYMSHYKPIVDLAIGWAQDEQKTLRLFSIGEDRVLVEYDLKNFPDNNLKLLKTVRIEQTAIPRAFCEYPKSFGNFRMVVSNNEYKLKVIDVNTHMCQKTVVGPTADTPINFIHMTENDPPLKRAKMIYATDKHIGIMHLPLTGNPFEGMGMVGHPEKLGAVALSHDSQYIFTSGKNSHTMLMWKVNLTSVDVAAQLGGNGLDPFTPLIKGGPNSFLFKEIQDFFYYAQIIHQGEDPNVSRTVSKTLSICEIPDLFRSLGYYPTDYEVDNLIHELKHLTFDQTGELVSEVTFEECVKAFLNHRPVGGITLEQINKALTHIADKTDPTDIIVEKEELYKALEERGEAMSHAEAVGYLCILLLPPDENNPVPPSLSLKDFAENVLGIDLTITEESVRKITHAFKENSTAED